MRASEQQKNPHYLLGTINALRVQVNLESAVEF